MEMKSKRGSEERDLGFVGVLLDFLGFGRQIVNNFQIPQITNLKKED